MNPKYPIILQLLTKREKIVVSKSYMKFEEYKCKRRNPEAEIWKIPERSSTVGILVFFTQQDRKK